MLTNNDKCLNTNSNFWLLGGCKKGGVVNELPIIWRKNSV